MELSIVSAIDRLLATHGVQVVREFASFASGWIVCAHDMSPNGLAWSAVQNHGRARVQLCRITDLPGNVLLDSGLVETFLRDNWLQALQDNRFLACQRSGSKYTHASGLALHHSLRRPRTIGCCRIQGGFITSQAPDEQIHTYIHVEVQARMQKHAYIKHTTTHSPSAGHTHTNTHTHTHEGG